MAKRPRLITRSTAIALSFVLLLGTPPLGDCDAQSSVWSFSGDVGGALGGTWLEGPSVPTVSSGTGVAVAVAARRSLRSKRADGAAVGVAAGVALRLAAQPIRLRELGSRWDGGTLTDAQLMGTLIVPIDRTPRRRADIELGAGVSVLSGANTLYPFTALGRTLPTLESGVVLFRGRVANADASRITRPIGVFARYGVTRVDPTPSPADDVSATATTAGWVGRITVGLRVQR